MAKKYLPQLSISTEFVFLFAAGMTWETSGRNFAEDLEKGILVQLSDLGMGRTRFSVRLGTLEKPTANGIDDVEFLISPNPGEPLRPLAAIASTTGASSLK